MAGPPPSSPAYLPPAGVSGPAPRGGPPPEIRNYPPGPQPPTWRYPADTGVRTLPPPNAGYANQQRSVVQLQAPTYDPGPATMPRVKEEETRTAPPSQPSQPSLPSLPSQPSQPSLPSQPSPVPPKGIPQFAMARDQVASGQRPFDEGFSWLKQENYRTILHLRGPGEEDSADREAATQRGLQFRSLDVSPENLTPALVDDFAKTVNDRDALPLFVYDRDGVAAGAMWYLYFRSVDKLSDAESRTKASRLGFRDDEDSKKMLLAIQKYLNDQLR